MTRAGRKTDAATTLLMVLLILTAVKLLLERLLALMLPHDLHQNTRLLLSMAQEALLIGLPALLMRRGRSARTGTMLLSIGLLLCAAVLGLAMRALATPLTQLWGNFLSAPDSQIAAADSAGKWCLQLLALAVLPAVLEEALFRGVVLQTLLDSGSRFGAGLLTTLFFSLLHGNLAALPAHLLFGIAGGEVFPQLLPLEFQLLLLVGLRLRQHGVDHLVIQQALLRQLFQADALGVGRGAVVQCHRVQHRPLLIRV